MALAVPGNAPFYLVLRITVPTLPSFPRSAVNRIYLPTSIAVMTKGTGKVLHRNIDKQTQMISGLLVDNIQRILSLHSNLLANTQVFNTIFVKIFLATRHGLSVGRVVRYKHARMGPRNCVNHGALPPPILYP